MWYTQDDLLFAELTTYETLYFAALLRLPRSWSRADKLARVEMVLAGLGLERCRDTIIGNHMMRGVSGGERKRVSIGGWGSRQLGRVGWGGEHWSGWNGVSGSHSLTECRMPLAHEPLPGCPLLLCP